MSTTEPEDERPEDESAGEPADEEVEGIRYFDFSDPFEPRQANPSVDPFALEDPSAPLPPGSRSRRPDPIRSRETSGLDPFEHALSGDLSKVDPPSPAPVPDRDAAGPPDAAPATFEFFNLGSLLESPEQNERDRFADLFDAARADKERPFLALALRMPPAAPEAEHFPDVVESVRAMLGEGDALLADANRLRLVAVLPGRSAEVARAFLAQFRDQLGTRTGDVGRVLRAISALVAPEGRPFRDGAAFLAEAYDGA